MTSPRTPEGREESFLSVTCSKDFLADQAQEVRCRCLKGRSQGARYLASFSPSPFLVFLRFYLLRKSLASYCPLE